MHTKGPWEAKLAARDNSANGAAIWAGEPARRFVVAKMPRTTDRPYSQKLSDLALIASAPDLLEALEECADDLEAEIEARRGSVLERTMVRDLATVVKARAAIAKAKGEA